MSDALAKALLRRHPEYDSRYEHWEFLRACYEGGREWFDENLFQYWKEGADEYAARKNRAYRFNHSREVVDLVNKYLFRAQIMRGDENVPEAVRSFWDQSTKEGLDIDYLMRSISKEASIFGRIYVMVDSNRQTSAPLSVAAAREAGIRTFAYIINPLDALDMSFDEQDQLNWILIRETTRDDSDFANSSGDIEERLRLWTRTGWILYRITEYAPNEALAPGSFVSMVNEQKYTIEILGQGEHSLGRVPVIVHDNVEHDSNYYAPSLINDIAYQDRAVANYLSNLDAIIQDQTFSQLAIPAQALMPGEEEQTKNKLIEMGTKRIFLYNAEAGVAPQFLSPDPKQVDVIITAVRQVINEIYHSVGLAGERTKQDNSMGIDNSSGVAKAYDFERINALLSTKAKALQRVEHEIVRLVMAWNGEKVPMNADPLKWVKYADTFDVRGLADEFDIAKKLSEVAAPRTVRRYQMSSLVDKLMPVLPESERKQVEKELEEWPVQVAPMSPNDSSPSGGPPGSTVSDPKASNQGSVPSEPLGGTTSSGATK